LRRLPGGSTSVCRRIEMRSCHAADQLYPSGCLNHQRIVDPGRIGTATRRTSPQRSSRICTPGEACRRFRRLGWTARQSQKWWLFLPTIGRWTRFWPSHAYLEIGVVKLTDLTSSTAEPFASSPCSRTTRSVAIRGQTPNSVPGPIRPCRRLPALGRSVSSSKRRSANPAKPLCTRSQPNSVTDFKTERLRHQELCVPCAGGGRDATTPH